MKVGTDGKSSHFIIQRFHVLMTRWFKSSNPV